MQTEAIISAACQLKKEGKEVKPEIMVPLVGLYQEFDFNEEDDGQHERSYFEVMKRQKATFERQQEEMKQIILEDPDTRINTLRHIFGIDKYKTILENVGILRLKLREEK